MPTALALPEADGFALAGGGAMLAHRLIERPIQDIDLFTTLDRSVPGLTRSLSDAMTATGSSVTIIQQSDTFARLLLTSPEDASTTVDLAHDPRPVDAVPPTSARCWRPRTSSPTRPSPRGGAPRPATSSTSTPWPPASAPTSCFAWPPRKTPLSTPP